MSLINVNEFSMMSISCGKRTWRQKLKLKHRLSRQSALGNLLLDGKPPTHTLGIHQTATYTDTKCPTQIQNKIADRQTGGSNKSGSSGDSLLLSLSIIISSCSELRKKKLKALSSAGRKLWPKVLNNS